MKGKNEWLGNPTGMELPIPKGKGVFDDLVKEIRDNQAEQVAEVLDKAIRVRPGRNPRLTNGEDNG